MIEVEQVSFRYERPVIEDVSFAVSPGEMLAIAGPNGSGKTTLLRLVRGLLRPERGQVRLEGRPIERMARRVVAQQIGYVLQEHALNFPLRVSDYVMHGRFARTGGLAFESPEDHRAVLRALELTRTDRLASRPVLDLSGGERQRVMLARALAGEPAVLLLDEPTANMDIAFQIEMMKLVKSLTRAHGLMSILITHELNLASEFADRMLFLRDGKVFAFGKPKEIVTRSNLEAVFGARFIVDANPETAAPRITIAAYDQEP